MSAQVFDETQVSFKRPEVQVALRNHGNFLEAMKHDITPTGMHVSMLIAVPTRIGRRLTFFFCCFAS
jgi:hypothetical protein